MTCNVSAREDERESSELTGSIDSDGLFQAAEVVQRSDLSLFTDPECSDMGNLERHPVRHVQVVTLSLAMLKCPELKKLPKAPRFTSVNVCFFSLSFNEFLTRTLSQFRSQTPGTISNLLTSRWPPPRLLDPSHPAASLSRKHFKHHTCDAFRVVAYPTALLGPPDRVWEFMRPLDTWKDRMTRLDAKGMGESSEIPPMILNNQTASRISMSFVSTANKKQSKKRVIRLKLGSRLKTAINLVVVRGIDVAVGNSGRRKLVMNEQEAKDKGDKWILPGIHFVRPLSEVFITHTIVSRLELHFSSFARSLPDVIPRSHPACADCVAIYLGQWDEIGEKVGSSGPP